jgi:hypothetical protein
MIGETVIEFGHYFGSRGRGSNDRERYWRGEEGPDS